MPPSLPKINAPKRERQSQGRCAKNDSQHAPSCSPTLAICHADRRWHVKFLNVLLYHSMCAKTGSYSSNSLLHHPQPAVGHTITIELVETRYNFLLNHPIERLCISRIRIRVVCGTLPID